MSGVTRHTRDSLWSGAKESNDDINRPAPKTPRSYRLSTASKVVPDVAVALTQAPVGAKPFQCVMSTAVAPRLIPSENLPLASAGVDRQRTLLHAVDVHVPGIALRIVDPDGANLGAL